MAVYTMTKTYKTKGNMGMIDVTDDFPAISPSPWFMYENFLISFTLYNFSFYFAIKKQI